MDCIPYINDLQLEIDTLKELNKGCKSKKIEKQIRIKEEKIAKCKYNLSKLSKGNIEYRIYLKLLDGKTASKAIKEIADENYINNIKPSSEASLWMYYKKLKEIIHKQ